MFKLPFIFLFLISAANANDIKTIFKCQNNKQTKKVEVLYQLIGNEERLLVLRGKSANSYMNCKTKIASGTLHFKCEAEEFANDIEFSYFKEKQTAVLTHGLFKFRKHLSCQSNLNNK